MWSVVLECVDDDWTWKDNKEDDEARGFLDRVKRLLDLVDSSNH